MPAAEDAEGEKRRRRTTDELRELAKSVRDGTHQCEGKPKRSLDFSTYSEAQANELADTLNLTRKFVDRASARIPERGRKGRGRPAIPARDVAKALLLQACFGVSSVGVHTLMYGAFTTTSDHSVSELSRFPSLVAETRINCPSFEIALADTLYANRVACEVAARYGVRLYSLPKTNSTFRSQGVPSWKEMTYEFVDDPQKFLERYHDRSLAETSNSMDKTKFPWKIRRRIPHRKDAASSLRRYLHNIRRYGYLGYLKPELIVPLPN